MTNDGNQAERLLFEADASPMGFDLARGSAVVQSLTPEPWSEYADNNTGHRWAGWLARAATSPQAAPVVPSHLFGALCHARDIVKSRTIWKAGTPSADHAEAVLADLDAIITANRPSPDAVQAAPAPEAITQTTKEKACTKDCASAAKCAAGSAATTMAVRSTPTTPDAASPAVDPVREALEKDAERWRWITEDHADRATREACRELIDRLPTMSYSAACEAIDRLSTKD
ncbi:MAG: hypothetical protein J0H69_17140 [Burkholderiales bacterium]|nr:hypothetical protein [Burkholderiales bacterium]